MAQIRRRLIGAITAQSDLAGRKAVLGPRPQAVSPSLDTTADLRPVPESSLTRSVFQPTWVVSAMRRAGRQRFWLIHELDISAWNVFDVSEEESFELACVEQVHAAAGGSHLQDRLSGCQRLQESLRVSRADQEGIAILRRHAYRS